VEVRPGYLARWLEFNVLDKSQGEKPLEIIQKRHAYDVKETQKNAELDHQKHMDGVNRDFTEQAIQLRIQIEEAKLGRELTSEEKQEIINSQLK
jgi:F0F1-type ATP synthase membrane subunit b/b'